MTDKTSPRNNVNYRQKLKVSPYQLLNNKRLCITILIFTSVVVYLNTLVNGFVLDDHVAITDNGLVTAGISSIGKLLVTPYHFGWNNLDIDNLYRPLSLIFFAVIHSLFGQSPTAYHMLNIVLFSGCTVVLFLFLDKLFDGHKRFAAFAACILFALHPVHTEVVANIKSCDELLCFLLLFAGLIQYILYANTGNKAALANGCVFFIFSLLAKETSLSFAVIIPLLFYFYKNENRKRTLYISISAISVCLIYLCIRFAVLSHYHIVDNVTVAENFLKASLPLESRLATVSYVMGYYLKLLVVPYPLSCDYSIGAIEYQHLWYPLPIVSLMAYLLLFAIVFYRGKKYSKDPFALGVFFYLLTIAIFSNSVFLIGATMAERFLFFGSVGYCFVVALLVEELSGMMILKRSGSSLNRTSLFILLPICLVYFTITFFRNEDWHDNKTLYTTDLRHKPADARLNYYVGDEMLQEEINSSSPESANFVDTMRAHFKKAIEIYPDYMLAEYDLGLSYARSNVYDSAEKHFLRSIVLDPHQYNSMKNLAYMYYNQKQFLKSAIYNERLLTFFPEDKSIYLNIGFCFLNLHEYDSCIKYMKKGVVVLPKEKVFYANIAYAYKVINVEDSARRYDSICQHMN